MKRTQRTLRNSRAPGEVGVEFSDLQNYRRPIIISSPGVDELCITVGCYSVSLTAAELLAIADEAQTAALAAMPPEDPGPPPGPPLRGNS